MERLEFYERCGARQFQKMVFIVEKIKYKLLKPFTKLAIHLNDKMIDRKLKKALNKTSLISKIIPKRWKKKQEDSKENLEEQKWIISYYQKEKLRFRREIAQEKNRNYHLDMNNVNQTLYYLEQNKKIHQNDIILNGIKSIIAIIGMQLFTGIPNLIALICLCLQGVSVLINFECINLQNYNILRIQIRKEQLEKIQYQKNKKSVQKYGEAGKAISPLLEQTTLPKKEEIASCITTLEQLRQMREMITAIETEKQKQYTKKGA